MIGKQIHYYLYITLYKYTLITCRQNSLFTSDTDMLNCKSSILHTPNLGANGRLDWMVSEQLFQAQSSLLPYIA